MVRLISGLAEKMVFSQSAMIFSCDPFDAMCQSCVRFDRHGTVRKAVLMAAKSCHVYGSLRSCN